MAVDNGFQSQAFYTDIRAIVITKDRDYQIVQLRAVELLQTNGTKLLHFGEFYEAEGRKYYLIRYELETRTVFYKEK